MRTKIVGMALFVLCVGPMACGPDCYKEEKELVDCQNLVLAGTLACVVQAGGQTDATQSLAQSNLCTTTLLGGLVGCSTQESAWCRE
ncbi:MAG: hypothetical protein KDK39_04640 [Leptospiraceae bacterium]|nr:hypothetical protein [Leptospiraceae bacterium]